jgi:ABC-type transport system involved in multi-copper enzyme maturation permease subunit
MVVAFELILLLLALQAFVFYVILLSKQKIFHLVYTFFMLYISYRLYAVYTYVNDPATSAKYSESIMYIISDGKDLTNAKKDVGTNLIGLFVLNVLFTGLHMWQFFAPSRIALNASSLPSYGGFRSR